MKREAAIALSEQAIEELSRQLASGKTEELERYLRSMSTFHDYSWGNILLIVKQQPNATLVAGFKAWQNKHGRTVKKGEKGICILAPLVRKQKNEEDEETAVFGFRAVHVFDVSQTEGETLPEPNRIAGNPGERLKRLHEVAEQRGIKVVYLEDLDGAEGRSKGGVIELRQGLTTAEEFNTLAHEIAHETMHHTLEAKQRPPRGIRELEAEAVAFVVSWAAGLTNALKQSADYIQSYDGNAELLMASLSRVQQTASAIITELEAESEAACVELVSQASHPGPSANFQ